MTKEEYQDFVLRYKGYGACFPMYHTLSRREKMWFTAIQKDVTELEKEKCELLGIIQGKDRAIKDLEWQLQKVLQDNDSYQADNEKLEKENTELKEELNAKQVVLNDFKSRVETVTDRFNKKSSQLTKAKEIIKDYMIIAKGGNITVCSVLKENRSINVLKLNEQAEQFLKKEQFLKEI